MGEKPTYEELKSRIKELEKELSEYKNIQNIIQIKTNNIEIKSDNAGKITFEELFDIDEIQALQEKFSDIMGVASLITHPDGTPITKPSNFCRLCNDIIRQTDKGRDNCYKSDAALGKFSSEGPIIRPCMSGGLWDAGAAISIENTHIGNWLIGQVRDDTQSVEKIREYARKINANEEEMVEAFLEVPSMSRERFGQIANILYIFANQLSMSAFYNYQKTLYITELKRSQDALQRNEAYLHTLIRTIPDLVWLKDPDGKYLFCNSRFENFFGAKEDEITGKTDYDFVERDLADLFRKNDKLAIETGSHSKNEEEITFADDGHKETLETVKTPIFREDGCLIGVLGIGRDITRFKEAEKERLTNLNFFENLDKINKAIQSTNDFEQMIKNVLDATLSVLNCDRAFLAYPCDPDAPSIKIIMERTTQDYPGAFKINEPIITPHHMKDFFRTLLIRKSPDELAVESMFNPNDETINKFQIKSMLSMALFPRTGKPWEFGLHQCSYVRHWSDNDKKLFQEIGRRLSDGLSSLLVFRDLQKSEEFLNNIYENIPNMLFIKDAEKLNFVKFNKAGEELLGYSKKELVGRNQYDFFPKDIADFFTSKDREVLQSKKLLDIPEEIITDKKNNTIYLHTKKIPILDETGEPEYLLGISEDITERKKAEKELKEIKERLQLFMDSATDSMSIFDSNMLLVEINKTALSYFNSSTNKEELIGKHILDVFPHIKKGGTLYNNYKKVLTTGEPFFAVDIIEINNKKLWFNLNIFRVGNGIGILASNITSQKIAEDELRETKERLQSFMDSASDFMAVLNSSLNFVEINEAGLNFFPDTPEKKDLIGMDMSEFTDKFSKFPIIDRLEQVLETGKPYLSEELISIESNTIWVLIKIFKVGEGIGLIISDITERKKLEEQLNQVQRIESIGRLAGGVAHDYNNVLGIIIGYADLGLNIVSKDDRLYSYLQEIMKAARKSAELTHQLLAFARKQTITPKLINLNDTFTAMLNMLRSLIGEHIKLTWKPYPELWPVKIDPSQIDQILTNLCVNSRDAIEDVGSITVETRNVTLDNEYCSYHQGCDPGDYVMLNISDNGKGIEKDILDKIFEPFFTTKRPGKGTGLGLSTVYGIIKQNNGYINVYSEPGIGTSFKLFFPRQTETNKEVFAETDHETEPGSETILLVEDDQVILNMTSIMLKNLGYNVLSVSKAVNAVSIAADYPGKLHLLLTDVIMPDMNGRVLADKILENRPEIKCLFMSGYTDNVIAHHGVINENVNFIQKPFSTSNLASKIRETLDSKKLS